MQNITEYKHVLFLPKYCINFLLLVCERDCGILYLLKEDTISISLTELQFKERSIAFFSLQKFSLTVHVEGSSEIHLLICGCRECLRISTNLETQEQFSFRHNGRKTDQK